MKLSVAQIVWLLDIDAGKRPNKRYPGKGESGACHKIRKGLIDRSILDFKGSLTSYGRATVAKLKEGAAKP